MVTTNCWEALKCAPQRLAMPDYPEATSPALTEGYHIKAENITEKIGDMLHTEIESTSLARQRKHPHDVPGDWFTGPF